MDTIFSVTRINQIPSCNSIVYNLLCENEHEYGIECYIKGRVDTDYCLILCLSQHRKTAENILRFLSRHKVYPIHVWDVIEDLYTY